MSIEAARLHLCIADLAKVSPHVRPGPIRAAPCGAPACAIRTLQQYYSSAFLTEEQLRWAQIGAAAKGADEAAARHKYALYPDGAEIVEVDVAHKGNESGVVARVAGLVTLVRKIPLFLRLSVDPHTHTHQMDRCRVGWCHFSVLNSTGSAFENFVRDEYMRWMIGASARLGT